MARVFFVRRPAEAPGIVFEPRFTGLVGAIRPAVDGGFSKEMMLLEPRFTGLLAVRFEPILQLNRRPSGADYDTR